MVVVVVEITAPFEQIVAPLNVSEVVFGGVDVPGNRI